MNPLDLFNLLGAAASISSLLLGRGYEDNVRTGVYEYSGEIPPRYRELLTSREGIDLINAMIIDRELLDEIIRQLREAERRYRKGLGVGSRQARQAADRRAEMEICEHLNRIKMRNGGDLPLEDLRDAWRSYGCVDD
jgi:hypothetical protein